MHQIVGYVPSFTAGAAISPQVAVLMGLSSAAMARGDMTSFRQYQLQLLALNNQQAAQAAAAQGNTALASHLSSLASQAAQQAGPQANIIAASAAQLPPLAAPAPVMDTSAIPTVTVPAQPAREAPMGRLPYGGSPAVEEQQPRNVRQYPLGFTQLAVPAAQTAIVTSRPQVLFRGYRLIVPTSGGAGPAPASPAVNFVIVDIRVGKNSQLVQASELPASIFQETSFDIALTMDTAQISQDIAITVRNTDAVNARDFRAVLIGAALE